MNKNNKKQNLDRNKSLFLLEDLAKKYKFYDYHKTSFIYKPLNINYKKYPETWVKIFYKIYPRFKFIKLPNTSNHPLIKIINKRKSQRNFNKYKISLKEINFILSGTKINRKLDDNYYLRAYPSAGARYPTEVYVYINYSKDLRSGLYHFNVINNSLEFLWPVEKNKIVEALGNQNFVKKSSIIIIMTSSIKRLIFKYGERSYRLALIEIGHIAQNMLLLGCVLGLKSCPLGGFLDQKLMNILDIMEDELELPIYAIVFGK